MNEKNMQFQFFSTRSLFFQDECPGIFPDAFSQAIKELLEFSCETDQIASRVQMP